jgi:hypothetical protein
MAWQLVYTSAPALIDAGRSGFGTVARHEAIRPALQTELERISQFSREQGLSKNRILFYHRVLDLRGERYHVLSRIKDAGSDYTGRTNHIAHHIVLTAAEAEQCYRTTRCSPADMILWATSNGLWHDQWNEAARLFDSSEEIAVGSIPARLSLPAVSWGLVTGSAANAAILAPGGTATEGCWLLYREDQASQLLSLIGEALCLHSNPWAISFTTDTQPTDRIEEFQWRGVGIGSPLERTARQSVRPVLDLGDPASLPPPVDDALAHLAETGLRKAPPPASSHGRVAATGSIESGSRVKAQFTSGRAHARSSSPTISSLRDKKQPDKSSNQSIKPQIKWHQLLCGALIVIVCLLGTAEFCLYKVDVNQACLIKDEINKKANSLIDKQNVSIDFIGKLNVELRGLNLFQEPKVIKNLNEINTELNSIQNLTRFDINEKLKNPNTLKKRVYRELAGNIPQPEPTPKPTPVPTPPAAKTKTEQTISLKISGNPIASGQSITATNGQKLQLEATSSSGTQVSINGTGQGSVTENKTLVISGPGSITLKLSATGNEQMNAADTNVQIIIAPPPTRITKIEFFDNSKKGWDYFFNNSETYGDLPGWSFYQTNGMATNLVSLLAVPFTAVTPESFITTYPQSKKVSINENAANPGSCFFRKYKATQEITLTITADQIAITNVLASNPIMLQKTGEQFACALSDNIASFVGLLGKLTNFGEYSLEYSIGIKPEVKGITPEFLATDINKKIKEMETQVTAAQLNLTQEQDKQKLAKETNNKANVDASLGQVYPDMENAGEILSAGMTFQSQGVGKPDGFPDELKTFSHWLTKNKKDRNIQTYTEYLKEVLAKIRECEDGLTFATDTYISSTKKIEDINTNNKPETPTEGRKCKNDKSFISNFNKLFNADWKKNLERFVAVPKARSIATPDFNMLRQNLTTQEKVLTNYKENICRSTQQIAFKKNGKDILIIITSP